MQAPPLGIIHRGELMRVLSLFDGMACGYLAFQSAGLPVTSYDAFEIDEYAVKVSSHNFPDIVHHGDVFEGDFSRFENVDYLIGGSPCTYWSIAQSKSKREREPRGMGWDLFSQYLRALEQAAPRYFIYENNASMSPRIRAEITRRFGFGPVLINSALVSAQNRERLYWVGKRTPEGHYIPVPVEQPRDRGIMLNDVLDGVAFADKSHAVIGSIGRTTPREYFLKSQGELTAQPINDTGGKARAIRASYYKVGDFNLMDPQIGQRQTGIIHKVGDRGAGGQSTRLYSVDGKAVTICGGAGGGGAQTGLYCVPSESKHVYRVDNGEFEYKGRKIKVQITDGDYEIRKLSVDECKRLQTVPEWYDMSVISKSQAYKCLGNGWTVEVIAHLIRATQTEGRKGQTSLDSF